MKKHVLFMLVTMFCTIFTSLSLNAQNNDTIPKGADTLDLCNMYVPIESDSVNICKITVLDTTGVAVSNESFWHNWFLEAGVGITTYLGENDRKGPWSGRFTPAFDLAVGKWIVPSVGLRAQLNGFTAKGYIMDGVEDDTAFGDPIKGTDGHMYYNNKWNYAYLRTDVMVNLSNAILGYDPDRFYSLIPYYGFGLIYSSSYQYYEFAGTFGIINKFKVTDALDVNLELKGTMLSDRGDIETETIINKKMEGIANLTVGITYNFGPKGWKQIFKYNAK